jgi:hypothetical protein
MLRHLEAADRFPHKLSCSVIISFCAFPKVEGGVADQVFHVAVACARRGETPPTMPPGAHID